MLNFEGVWAVQNDRTDHTNLFRRSFTRFGLTRHEKPKFPWFAISFGHRMHVKWCHFVLSPSSITPLSCSIFKFPNNVIKTKSIKQNLGPQPTPPQQRIPGVALVYFKKHCEHQEIVLEAIGSIKGNFESALCLSDVQEIPKSWTSTVHVIPETFSDETRRNRCASAPQSSSIHRLIKQPSFSCKQDPLMAPANFINHSVANNCYVSLCARPGS